MTDALADGEAASTEAARTEGALAAGDREHARLAATLESISDAFFSLDADWRITYVNAAAAQYWGRDPAALLGRTFADAFPEAVGSENGRAMARAMRERVTVAWEARSPVHGRWLAVRAYPAADGGLAVYFQDVEDRKRAEADLAMFRRIAEHSNDAQYLIDERGRIRWANRLASERMGYTHEELATLTVGDINPLVSTEAFGAYFARALAGRIAPFESVHRRKDGSTYPVEITPTVAELPGGARMLAAVRDVTERKAAEAERERLLAEAEGARAAAEAARVRAETAGREADEANRAKSGFLATMSHELRTPLNAILGYTQLLDLGLAGPLTEPQREYLERLTRSGHHLLALVNDVLDLSKIEAGEAQVAHRDATTGPAVRAALDLVRPQAAAKGVRLVDARPDEAGVPFVGDEDRVRQVIVNLLSNAVKFTAPGGTVTVTCGAADETPPAAGHLEGTGPWADVQVADTGVGIAPEEQARIFDPFFQVDGGHTRQHGGTGLGLAISRRLARLMGGDLTVESTPGAGSTFTLWLPAARHADGRQTESAGERSARAEREVALLQAPGLGEVGEVLHASADEILAAYTDRLRADPQVPRARAMRRIQLEDHAISFLADLSQSLKIVEDAGPEAAELLKDGSAIQRAVAEAHGARRHAQGFDEAAVRRDHQILREEVERAVRARLKRGSADVEAALRVLLGLIDRAEAISVRVLRRAAEAAASGGAR